VFDQHGNQTQHSAQRQGAGITHENLSRESVVPEKPQTTGNKRTQDNAYLTHPGYMKYTKIISQGGMTTQVSKDRVCSCYCHNWTDRQSVETICQVNSIRGAYNNENYKGDKQKSKMKAQIFKQRKGQFGRKSPADQ